MRIVWLISQLAIIFLLAIKQPVYAITFLGTPVSDTHTDSLRAQYTRREMNRTSYLSSPDIYISDPDPARVGDRYFGQSPAEILQHNTHYLDPSFVAFAKTLPGYEEHIYHLYNELQMLDWGEKLWRIIWHSYSPGLTDQIARLRDEIELQHHERHKQAVARQQEAIARRERERVEEQRQRAIREKVDAAQLCCMSVYRKN
jgi:hypothetical protein